MTEEELWEAENRPRVHFSLTSEITSWEPVGYYLDYSKLRSWLRHPIQTFSWWRHSQAPRKR